MIAVNSVCVCKIGHTIRTTKGQCSSENLKMHKFPVTGRFRCRVGVTEQVRLHSSVVRALVLFDPCWGLNDA